MRIMSRLARLGAIAALATASFVMAVETADARGGRGGSLGSRGSKTHTAPPSTTTAPGQTAPVNRSITQPGQSATAAASTANAASQASRFGGLKGLLLGGLIGAGLASLFGVGALASVLGFLLQMLLIAGVVMLVVSFFRSRRTGQPMLAGARAGAGGRPVQPDAAYRATPSSLGGGAGSGVAIQQADYNSFERLLDEIQTAYGQNDVEKFGQRVTPEMLSYFAQELDENAKQGVINDVSQAKLLQGDLAEAWREPGVEFATVAMRYSLIDVTVESKTGRVVAGSKDQPQEVTEVWTFRRPANGTPEQWELSAIQQTR